MMIHNNKKILLILGVACLLSSCISEKIDIKKMDIHQIKPIYQEEGERLLYGGMLKESVENDAFIVKENTCTHEFGFGYRKDSNTHTYACRRCGRAVYESEPHADITIHQIACIDGIYVFGMKCAVCSGELMLGLDTPFFLYYLSKDSEGVTVP